MATREAQLKLRLDLGSFGSDLKSAEKKVTDVAKNMGGALSKSMSKGLGAATDAVKGLGTGLKQAVGWAASLGGTASISTFVVDAIHAEEAAGKIAARLRAMGEASSTTAGVLAQAVNQAHQLNSTTHEVLEGYDALLEATGDPIFSKDATASIATFRDAFRISTTESASLVALLREKLGATTDEINTQFGPALLDATSKGGLSIQDLVQNGNKLLAVMPALGLKGADGMTKLTGMLNLTDDAGGDLGERMMGLQGIMLKFKSGTFLAKLKKDVKGIEFDKGADAVTNFQKVLGQKGGMEALQKLLGASPRTAKMFAAMVQPFADAKEEALKAGKTDTEARLIAIETLRGRVDELTTITSTEVSLRKEAAARTEEKGRKLELAIDKMRSAFESPAVLGAIDRLAENLPAFADGVAHIIEFVTKHPALAVGGVVGAQVGGAAATAVGGSLLASAGRAIIGQGAVAGVAAVEGGAAAVAPVAATGLTAVGANLAGIAAAGGAAGAAVVAGVALAGAAAGGLIGNEIRKAFVDSAQEAQAATHIRTQEVLMDAESAGNKGASTEQKKAALVSLGNQGKEVMDSGSALADLLAEFTVLYGGAKAPETARAEQIMALGEQEVKLSTQIALREQAEKRMAAASLETAKAQERLNAAMNGASRGPLPPAAAAPGSAPQGG
jgi:hypothetical protein